MALLEGEGEEEGGEGGEGGREREAVSLSLPGHSESQAGGG